MKLPVLQILLLGVMVCSFQYKGEGVNNKLQIQTAIHQQIV